MTRDCFNCAPAIGCLTWCNMAKRMSIAELNKYIRIQRKVLTADGSGGQTEAWKDVALTWAAVKEYGTISGMSTTFENMRTMQEVTHQVTIRYNFVIYHELKSDDRIWRAELPDYPLQVMAWRASDNRRYIEISCREVRP